MNPEKYYYNRFRDQFTEFVRKSKALSRLSKSKNKLSKNCR